MLQVHHAMHITNQAATLLRYNSYEIWEPILGIAWNFAKYSSLMDSMHRS